MRTYRSGAGAAIAVFVGAMAIQAASTGDAVVGKTVYTDKCKICHGVDGAGATGYAKAMKLEPAQLSSDAVQKKTDAELKKVIREGSGKMKPIKGLGDADLDNVIAYVRSLKKK